MKIHLICFGRLKTPGFEASVAEFQKRLSSFVNLQVSELKPEVVSEKSDSERKHVQSIERDRIHALIEKAQKPNRVWICDERGESLPTREWEKSLRDYEQQGIKEWIFIIGSGLGLHPDFFTPQFKKVSFGKQTVSHELSRLIFIEQMYRAYSLRNGHPYHNEG